VQDLVKLAESLNGQKAGAGCGRKVARPTAVVGIDQSARFICQSTSAFAFFKAAPSGPTNPKVSCEDCDLSLLERPTKMMHGP
jgi:hypothetical protein